MKKILSKISMLLVGLIVGVTITACATDVIAEQTYPLKIWKENDNGMCSTWTVVDDYTGVNYVVVTTWYSSGNSGGRSVAITPRLNADGTLYVSK